MNSILVHFQLIVQFTAYNRICVYNIKYHLIFVHLSICNLCKF